MPHESAAVSAQILYTPYTHAPCHFMQSCIRKVYACLAVICNLHFWQNDLDLLRATAVTRGWNGYRNKSQHRKLTLEKKILQPLCRDSNPGPFNHESGALTTELSVKQSSVLGLFFLVYLLVTFHHTWKIYHLTVTFWQMTEHCTHLERIFYKSE